jgi:hypothetical protein
LFPMANKYAINIVTSHCEPEGRGNHTPSQPSPLEGEGWEGVWGIASSSREARDSSP